ncbi:hypothetical protein KCX83_17265 [Brucella oryzae]|uniref:hypothetical protein n=1 Tax=Brucella oryzae TaxID=335286 RepID=UPI001B810C3B|nr:hypothetical protein [Brucella oryzae]MBR7654068.1 hypothetical protein [Brucella oryzae]
MDVTGFESDVIEERHEIQYIAANYKEKRRSPIWKAPLSIFNTWQYKSVNQKGGMCVRKW